MFFREIFFLLFKYLRFDELRSDPASKNEFEELFQAIKEKFEAALEELGENLQESREAEEEGPTPLTPVINERIRELININSIFLLQMNRLIENFGFDEEKKDNYQSDINELIEVLRKVPPFLGEHLFGEAFGRLSNFLDSYENNLESEKILEELEAAEDHVKKESELIQKIALNQIEFERTRLGKKEVKENELPEYKKRLEKSNTKEVIEIRKETILEIHKKRQEKNNDKTIEKIQNQLVQEQQAHQQTKDKLNAIPSD